MIVDVWFVACDVSPDAEARYASLLTASELARAMKYRFEGDRRRSIVGRGALRKLLSRYVDAPAEIDDSQGKPRLRNSKIEFNVSHSGDLVGIAIAEFAVGLDVERLRHLGVDALAIARRHFSQDEVERIACARDEEREFYSIWTAKEAVVKAAGAGLALDPATFAVPRDAGKFVPVIGLESWSVRSLTAYCSGYEAALAIPSRESAAAVVEVRSFPQDEAGAN